MEDELLAKLRATLTKFGMIAPGDRVVVAVSGGPDSVALLHGLWRLRGEGEFSLHAAHFDHGLRTESAEDAAYVRELAVVLGIPCTVGAGRVRERAARGKLSLQAAARQERYAFLQDVARREQATKVALGHNRDDQAETVIWRLLRGAGLDGLAAIRPVRPDGFVRPLLFSGRAEIEEYCERQGLSPCFDPSNRKPVYLRNRLRLHLLPVLEDYNPRVREAVARTAEELRADAELLEELAGAAWERLCRQEGEETVGLVRPGLAAQPLALRRRLLRRAAFALGSRVEFPDVERLLTLVADAGTTDLPGMVAAWTDGEILRLGKRRPSPLAVRLEVPGDTFLPSLGIRLRAQVLPGGASVWEVARHNAEPSRAFLDAAKAEEPWVRLPRTGDRFRPLGLGGTQKLGDFFTHRKVARASRPFIPLVVAGIASRSVPEPEHPNDGEIAWVAGYGPAEGFKVEEKTARVLCLEMVAVPGAIGAGCLRIDIDSIK